MPMTPSSEAIGKRCADCGGDATHEYAGDWICCECHIKWARAIEPAETAGSDGAPIEYLFEDEEIPISEELRKALEELS